MTPLFISILVFVGVSSLIGLLAFAIRDANPNTTNRLEILVGKRGRLDEQNTDILRKSAFNQDKKSLFDALMPQFLSLEKLFVQADCNIPPSTLFGIGVGLSALAVTTTILLRMSIGLALLNGVLVFFLPLLWLYWKRAQRIAKFTKQLPDAMELVARALRSGQSLAAAVHVVAEELPEPISVEFGRVFEEQNLGVPIEEALRAMTDRVPLTDLRFFVTSVAIQRQTGGDLAEILDKIGYIIRERFRILGQVQALTGEGRLSGIVLISLPFVLFGYLLNSNADYIRPLWETPEGRWMSVGALIAQVVGALVIRKIVDIKV